MVFSTDGDGDSDSDVPTVPNGPIKGEEMSQGGTNVVGIHTQA